MHYEKWVGLMIKQKSHLFLWLLHLLDLWSWLPASLGQGLKQEGHKSLKELHRIEENSWWWKLVPAWLSIPKSGFSESFALKLQKGGVCDLKGQYFSFNVTFQQENVHHSMVLFYNANLLESQTRLRKKAQLSQDFGKSPFLGIESVLSKHTLRL